MCGSVLFPCPWCTLSCMETSPLQEAHCHWGKCRSSCVFASHPAAGDIPSLVSPVLPLGHVVFHLGTFCLQWASFFPPCHSTLLATSFSPAFTTVFHPASWLMTCHQKRFTLSLGACIDVTPVYISFSVHMLWALIAVISVLLSSFYYRYLIHLLTDLNESFFPPWTNSLSKDAHQVASCLIAFLPVL